MKRLVPFFVVLASCVVTMVSADQTFTAEDQTPSGKFLTATEVRPILEMTKGNWVAVREYDGKDWLYFTHLISWRCGLHQIKYAVNDGTLEALEIAPCDPKNPNHIPQESQIALTYPLGGITSVTVEILYDDMQVQTETFQREEVQMP
ncbi:hypothetical protein [Shimia sp. SDUM112013]|uniref:hypothetical protein n=1 Tax=Shimia sp. SDUM112013 TaxID=3136160 RepID=UPI0032EEE0B9